MLGEGITWDIFLLPSSCWLKRKMLQTLRWKLTSWSSDATLLIYILYNIFGIALVNL